ncbi:prepilin peptidase [Phytoactinopolyspora limicola]|uniref:prepilin peptidase n=1 Tax=Phytoactinopolyspora limicola TaxID=2715536 RepID=UPI001408EAA3|nr:prepilin peptidase [Phytoactinopolyspora limicola]
MTPVLAGAGLVVGAVLPWVIAWIPDRSPDEDEPPPTPYRELAAARGLPVILAVCTAAAWALIGVASSDLGAATTAFLVVAAMGVAMAYVDIREHRLPDWLTVPALVAAAIALAGAAAVDDSWARYGRAWAGAGVVLAFYLLLVLLRPADLGLGDVKLAAVLGLLLGWIGWPVLVFGVFAGFVVGALLAAGLLLAGRAGRRTSIPFGPAMLLGALVAVVWGEPLVDAYLAL